VRFVVGSVRPRLVRPQCGVAQNDSDAKVAGSNAQNDLKGRVRLSMMKTYSPVGCSYLPVRGVSSVADTDMMWQMVVCP